MVKFYESSFTHDYPFPAVTLAYFLRYPNPFSTHVMSTDVLDRHFDPTTGILYTERLHLKRSKIPSALYKLLPRSLLGPMAAPTADGTTQSYVLERSAVDVRAGAMLTESRNLELTGILAVVERQLFRRPGADLPAFARRLAPGRGAQLQLPRVPPARDAAPPADPDRQTDVGTKVELYSRLGAVRERMAKARASRDEGAAAAGADEPAKPKMGFFKSWSTGAVQKSIETLGLQRTERAVPNSNRGLEVVLERLRTGGLVAVLEGMKRDRATAPV